ncbi:MAG: TlpA disulfide reductase family protein [Gemmatimonadetes bacterium]|nr:TlpA disulfide reductase family protein [Gemmatimonadota bacterium]
MAIWSSNKPKRTSHIQEENAMKSIKSAITIIATVATAFIYGVASAESITVKMESVREDSVEHLFQPVLMRFPVGPQLTEGLPDIQSVAGLEVHEPLHARLSFLDSPAEPIVVLGLDSDGQDIAFVVADSTAQPQRLQLTDGFSNLFRGEVLQAELTVPPAGPAPKFKLELGLSREHSSVMHRNLELRLGEANMGGQRYALALVRDPRFGTYAIPADSVGLTFYQLMIDLDGDGVFLTTPLGQTETLEDEVFEGTKPFLIDGQAYRLIHVSATGDQLVIERSDQMVALAVGFEMPNVTVTRLDSSAIELTALRGKPVVINWWHTACSPCIAEMPELNELVEKYADRDVEFLAIANNKMADLTPFLEKHPFIYDIAVANDDALQIFGDAYPRHVILDSKGKVAYDVLGYSADATDKMDSVIGSLLSEL